MNPQKQSWDTRAWLIGILGGAVGGSITAWANYPPIQKRLNALPYPAFLGSTADIVSSVSVGLTLLVLPGLVSGFARRMTFFWGLLPLCLFYVAIEMEDWYQNGIAHLTPELWAALMMLGISWVVSSGPVSFIRWQRVLVKRRAAAQQAEYQAMREAASVPQEGIWPPPPNHNVL